MPLVPGVILVLFPHTRGRRLVVVMGKLAQVRCRFVSVTARRRRLQREGVGSRGIAGLGAVVPHSPQSVPWVASLNPFVQAR